MRRRDFLKYSGGSALVACCPALALAADTGRIPGYEPVWPPFEKVEAQLQAWQRKHPSIMTLEVVARSAEGRAVYAAILTDPDADDENKEHVLTTAQHAGMERSGTTGLLGQIQWLLSDDPLARQVLQHQVVVFVPIVNPDGYVHGDSRNTQEKDPYVKWTLDGPEDPATMPEAVGIQKLMDQYQPEVHADYHGLDQSFPGYIMEEASGTAFSNLSLRPYHMEIIHMMNDAALAGGFPSDTGAEDDAERMLWGPELNAMWIKLWPGRPRPYAAIYCYNHYHSLVLAAEACWQQSTLLRYRRLLQVGNETWPGEYYAGYPTRIMSNNNFHSIVAYGATAAARRRSRTELWNKLGQIYHGMDNPQTEGAVLYVCATSPAAATKWLGDKTLAGFARTIQGQTEINSEPILNLLKRHPDGVGQWGNAAYFAVNGGGASAEQCAPIENGLAIRLRIPYAKAKLTDLRLNGRPIQQSEMDGYVVWVARGFTHVQVNIPPETSKRQEFFIVTCEYDPCEKRDVGWSEVKE